MNDGTHKVFPFGLRAELDLGDFLLQDLLESSLVPQRLGNIDSGQGGTFLALVFESCSNSLEDTFTGIGRRVVEVEVLATGFTDDSRVSSVVFEVVGDVLPELLEDASRAGKVQRCEFLVLDAFLDDFSRLSLKGKNETISGRRLQARLTGMNWMTLGGKPASSKILCTK